MSEKTKVPAKNNFFCSLLEYEVTIKKLKKIHDKLYKLPLMEIPGHSICGPTYEEMVEINPKLFKFMGFQATNLAIAAEIWALAKSRKSHICWGFTSNAGTSGIRDLLASLIRMGHVDSIVCTVGAIEQDVMKSMGSFKSGRYCMDDCLLNQLGINRTGNILVSNELYVSFERFMKKILKSWGSKTILPSKFINYMGSKLKSQLSFLKACHDMNVPIHCPAFLDGAMGDFFYFHNHHKIDIISDHVAYNNLIINQKETAIICLGGGAPKHYVCNANLLKDGANYAIYLNNSRQEQGSNAGAPPSQAISWGKISADAPMIKIFGDFTLNFHNFKLRQI